MGKRDIASMTELLKAKNRESAGFLAPACGLLLKKSDMNNRNNQGNASAFLHKKPKKGCELINAA